MDAKLINTLELNGDVSIPEKYIGPRGYSAYELAVKEGFEGTIDEWLESLHGEVTFADLTDTQKESLRGPAGKDGRDGEDAIAAINPRGNFTDGETYNKNDYVTADDGNTYTCMVDGITTSPIDTPEVWQLIALKGATGEKGADGLDGLPGANGLSNYQIAVKNGFEGTEEEWLESIRGPQGLSAYEVAVKNGYEGTEEEWIKYIESNGIQIKIVEELPETGETKVLYFLPIDDGTHDEYMWIDNKWELIGTTKVDLSDYYTKQEVDKLITENHNPTWVAWCEDDNVLSGDDGPLSAHIVKIDIDKFSRVPELNEFGLLVSRNRWNEYRLCYCHVGWFEEERAVLYVDYTVRVDRHDLYTKDEVDTLLEDKLITIKDTEVTNISQLPMDKFPCCLHMINSTFFYEFNDDIIYVNSVPGFMVIWTMDGQIAYLTYNDDGEIIATKQDSFVYGTFLTELFYNKDEVDQKIASISGGDSKEPLMVGEVVNLGDESVIYTGAQLPNLYFNRTPEVDDKFPIFFMTNNQTNGTWYRVGWGTVTEVTATDTSFDLDEFVVGDIRASDVDKKIADAIAAITDFTEVSF